MHLYHQLPWVRFLSLILLAGLSACRGTTTTPTPSLVRAPTFTLAPARTPLPTQTLVPTHTPQPTYTPSPTYTPTPSASPAPTATDTPLPTPTIQLPRLAFTPLPFTPELILPINANRVTELARWDTADAGWWLAPDGTPMMEQDQPATNIEDIEFSNDGKSLVLIPGVSLPSGAGNEIEPIVNHGGPNCSFSAYCIVDETGEKKCGGPGVLQINTEDGTPNNFLSLEGMLNLRLSPYSKTLTVQYEEEGNCSYHLLQLPEGNELLHIIPLIPHSTFGYSTNGNYFWAGDNDGNFAIYDSKLGTLITDMKFEWKSLDNEYTTPKVKYADYEIVGQPAGYAFQILAVSPERDTLISAIVKTGYEKTRHTNERVTQYSQAIGKLQITLWKLPYGPRMHTLVRKSDWSGNVTASFSPDGKMVAVYSSRKTAIGVYSTTDGKLLHNLGNPIVEYSRLEFTPDGQILLASSGGVLDLWDIQQEELLTNITPDAEIVLWAVSQDGKYIATVSHHDLTYSIIQLWGVAP
jgi:WD40 repeat protein